LPAVDADAVEIRVLGCLVEKQRTTPDSYPLTLNSLRLACNQSTNRDPVVEYDEPTIRAALDRLARRGWTRLASGPTTRVAKFRHLLDEAFGLSGAQLSLLAVLMLRGPQTTGELRIRTERLRPFGSVSEVEATLEELARRELVVRLPRRPGQKEERYAQLLGGDAASEVETVQLPAQAAQTTPADSELEQRVARLEAEVERLRRLVEGADGDEPRPETDEPEP
jgi:uncharacterized protein YceH (UPF0502 family)